MRNKRGFSLLELMCVLAVLSLFAVIGSAVFLKAEQKSKDRDTLIADVLNVTNALQEARQLSIESGESTYICGGLSCSGDWSYGFKVIQPDHLGGLYRKVVFDHDVRILWKGFPANKSRITFLPNGLSSYQNGTFWFCYLSWKTSIVINQSGRYYTSDIIDGDEDSCR
ncbi:GspH/FimT family pseudopilin [Marinomonas flavescens]|uniref:GspH/FimT family pseudopilin n=1 Tax=Marinomonas flavescens TaxID=2529379 RepID=UPI0010564321|nr:GspH/FimT family pseudopilin [Marinomonas flavescens]